MLETAKEGQFRLEECVAQVQSFCLGLRLEHWKTTDYELHKATEMTEDSLEGLLDTFVEAGVGMMGGERPDFRGGIVANVDEGALIAYLADLPTRDTSLLNIRDEMIRVLYKYRYLKTLK